MRSLVVILHYNTYEFTDRLYTMLKPFERDEYDLVVFDNGSAMGKSSQYTTVRSEENLLFGGGLNTAFQWVLDEPEYDSLLFLNSDLLLHGDNFVRSLRKEMINTYYKIISPCILQPETQCNWKTVRCWNSKTIRQVPWVDFQAPMIHRDFIERVKRFDDELCYGWGQDVLSGIICEENSWKVGVCDNVPILHLDSATIKKEMKNDVFMSSYWSNAERNMFSYFNRIGIMNKVNDFRMRSANYTYNEV